jgi:L-2-hydroxyglutarate oxidase LhgO
VPNLANPFLGVHFTVTVDGKVKIGPTAIPAFWREHYGSFENFNAYEFLEIMKRELGLIVCSQFEFKRLAFEEIRKYSRRYMVSLASNLAEGIHANSYRKWGRPGIRAQLIDIKEKKTKCRISGFYLLYSIRTIHL